MLVRNACSSRFKLLNAHLTVFKSNHHNYQHHINVTFMGNTHQEVEL